jgi:molecular chaperone GrpE
MTEPSDPSSMSSETPTAENVRAAEDVRAAGGEPGATASAPAETSAESAPVGQAAEMRQRLAETNERLLRALAEVDNVRKRAQRESEEGARRALERLFTDLLAVRDSLELGLAACRGEEGPVVEGLGMTLRQLDQIFERYGVETYDPLHAPFDPRYHEAMATRPEASCPPGEVVLVVQKGYGLHGRLLRPARVVVSAPPLDSSSPSPT